MNTSQQCDEARAVYAAWIAEDRLAAGRASPSEAAPTAWSTAARHLAECPVCQARLAGLANAVLAEPDAALPCAECRERIAATVAASLDGGTSPALPSFDPATGTHLAACADCAGVAAAVSLALGGLMDGSLPPPPATPRFDTSFVRSAPQSSPTSPSATPSSARRPATGTGGGGSQGRSMTPYGPALALALLAATLVGVLMLTTRQDVARTPAPPAPPTSGVEGPALVPTRVTRVAEGAPQSGIERSAIATSEAAAMGTAGSGSPAAGATSIITRALRTPTRRPTARASVPPTASPVPTATALPAATDEPPDDGDEREVPTPEALEPRCVLSGGLSSGILVQPCERFPARGAFDVHPFQVPARSRWRVSVCGETDVDTILAIYPASEFRAWAPCEGLVAYDDDACGTQSEIEADLDPGDYVLLVSDKTGDAPGPYRLHVWAEPGALGNLCPMGVP